MNGRINNFTKFITFYCFFHMLSRIKCKSSLSEGFSPSNAQMYIEDRKPFQNLVNISPSNGLQEQKPKHRSLQCQKLNFTKKSLTKVKKLNSIDLKPKQIIQQEHSEDEFSEYDGFQILENQFSKMKANVMQMVGKNGQKIQYLAKLLDSLDLRSPSNGKLANNLCGIRNQNYRSGNTSQYKEEEIRFERL